MGNMFKRTKGKNGAPSTTRNMNTGSVTHTHHAPGRKKGALGQHITKTIKSNGDVYLTETINYGDGSTKRTRTKQNKSRPFGSTTNGKPLRNSSASRVDLLGAAGGGCGAIFALIFLLLGAVVVFPLTVMFIFALPFIYPYILGAVALYFVWKITSEKGDRGDRG
jgi:hypothetical protein